MDRLRNHLTGWVQVGAILAALPVYRATRQRRYEWGLFGVTGTGRSGGYTVVLVAAIWAWVTVTLGHRAPGRPFPQMLIAWNGLMFVSMVWSAYLHGSEMRLRGDAMGLDIPLAWMGPTLTGALLAASVYWLRGGTRPSPSRAGGLTENSCWRLRRRWRRSSACSFFKTMAGYTRTSIAPPSFW